MKGAGPSTPPPIAKPLASNSPARSSSRHCTFDSNVREQPRTVNPFATSSPPAGESTTTSAASGRLSSHANASALLMLARDHLRFWSLNSEDGEFGFWTLVAAHQEHYVFPISHEIDSWEHGENLVQNSFRSSDNGSLLPWVDGISAQDFGNAGTFQDAYNNGQGRMIEVRTPEGE